MQNLGPDSAEMLSDEVEEILYGFSSWSDDWSPSGLRAHLGSEIARCLCKIEDICELDNYRANAILDMMDAYHEELEMQTPIP